jgi:cysteine-rich repeat protein
VILDDGSLKCWGWDEDNQVGDAKAPVQLYEPALDVAVGRAHVCALTASHLVRCWGHDDFGALGPTSLSFLSGVLLGGDNTAQTIASTRDAMCAIRTDGAVVCWGDPTWGQTHAYWQGLVIPSVQPEQMPPGRHATELSGGRGHFCALLDDQSVACWGEGFWFEPIPIDFGPRHTCGNAVLDPGEACDDGDLQAGDGCSESCGIEDGYSCSGAPSECRTTCGDYTLDRFEACELIDGGCDLTCHLMPGFAQVSFADLSGPGWGAVSPMVPYSTNGDVRVGDTSITNWGGNATLAADVCNDADVPYSVYPVIAWGRAPTPRDQTPLTLYPWQILSSGCVTAYLDFPINPSATGADLGVAVEVIAEDRDPSNNFRVVAILPIGAHCTVNSAVLTDFASIEAEICNDGLSDATCVVESAISSEPASPSFEFSDPPTELLLAPGACDWYFGAIAYNPQGDLIGAVSATPSWQYLAGRAPPVLTSIVRFPPRAP